MVDLDRVRKQWNLRPIEVDPSEIERKFPSKVDVFEEVPECCEENCHKPAFRWQPRCEKHHMQWIAQVEAENAKNEKEREKYLKSKKGQEEKAKSTAKATTYRCAECGVFLRYEERHVVPKSKQPRKVDFYAQAYKVVCQDCKK